MRKKFALLTAVHLVMLAFVAYPYLVYATSQPSEQSVTLSQSATPALPTSPPTSSPEAVSANSQARVSLIEWDPHNCSWPNQVTIRYPHKNDSLLEGLVYMQVGVSSSKWLINEVFYTGDWFSGREQIWYYNMGTCATALYAVVPVCIPEGTHSIVVEALLHDGTLLSALVSLTFEPKSGEQ
jgi:hypothetical protein